MDTELLSRSVLLTGTDPEAKRQEMLDYFHRTMDVYEALFDVLTDDAAYYERPEPLRHPLIFYFGHTATFYINKLVAAKATTRIDPKLEGMFAIGVDEMSWDDLNDAHYDWPAVDDVRAYRRAVRERVDAIIRGLDLRLPVSWDDHPAWAIFMCIEHERIHLETSSVLIRQLDLRWVQTDPRFPTCPDHGAAPENTLLPVPGGQVIQGKQHGHPLYGWDNEYGTKASQVKDFQASRYLVTNQEFLAFVASGGYLNADYWTEEGKRWLAYRQPEHPVFWVPREAGHDQGYDYDYRAMTEVIPMPWNWPVDVNYLEAKAFCNWKAEQTGQPVRLPTEAEYERLRAVSGVADEPDWPQEFGSAPGNINLEYWASSCPVDRFANGDFYDVVGNVWQWTETPIDGFEGFQPHPLYDDFSVPTFDERHNLIKGGAWVSTGNEATRDARYAFRRHFFQHAGFRYVVGEPLPERGEDANYYESDALLSQYCEFHYGRGYFGVANFPRALAEFAVRQMAGRNCGHALDMGCAVGRATFELAPHFDRVTGLDYSARFVQVAQAMLDDGEIGYALPTEGDLNEERWVRLADLNLNKTLGRSAEPSRADRVQGGSSAATETYQDDRRRSEQHPTQQSVRAAGYAGRPDNVEFWQQDACNLKPHFTGYDLVLAGNLIDRLYDPEKFLNDIAERLNPGGLLILASPYTWQTESTPREKWLGGFERDGRPVTTLFNLMDLLEGKFRMVGEPADLPFVIRETARKYQHTVSQVTVWERKS